MSEVLPPAEPPGVPALAVVPDLEQPVRTDSIVREVGPIVLVLAGLVLSVVALSSEIQLGSWGRTVALFAHFSFLVIGLGGVLTVDFRALRWVLGQTPITEVLELADHTHAQIWIGYVGLVLSGLLLSPSLGPATWVKVAAVIVVGGNGLVLSAMTRRGVPSIRALLVSGAVSQTAWWTATVIGFLHSAR